MAALVGQLMSRLVAVDWGTSSLRGALLDAGGKVLEERSDARGILKVPAGGFPAVFESLFADWMQPAGTRCLISGMAGSKQGWVEAPYCACPAGRVEVGRRIIDIDVRPDSRISIVPGLRDEHDGVPDVMRGEEVQIFGAMALMDVDEGVFVLPGTHNKWVTVKKGRVKGFRTFMTGEFYALLSQHSILARTLDADAPLDEAAFIYFLRRIPLAVGETYSFDRYFKPDRNPIRLEVLRRERIEVPAGTFETIVVRPIIKAKGIFSENGQAEVWLTDDDRHLMVQMKAKVSFGSLNLQLKSLGPPAD